MSEREGFSRREMLRLLGKVVVAAGASSVVARVLPGCGDADDPADTPEGCSLLLQKTQADDSGYLYEYCYFQCAADQAGLDCYQYQGYIYTPQGDYLPANGKPFVCLRVRPVE